MQTKYYPLVENKHR